MEQPEYHAWRKQFIAERGRPPTAYEAWEAATPLPAQVQPAEQVGDAFLKEGVRIIDALIVKSDCSLDRNQEFYDAEQWKGKARALASSAQQPAEQVGEEGR